MKKITPHDRNIRSLLESSHYALDYYQREYKWQTKQVQDLINDLTDTFLGYYDTKHDQQDIKNYGIYFLGSIITCTKNEKKYIIDGQQRLTTITLLLIYIRHRINDEDQKANLLNLIYSYEYGKKSFNIEVEERNKILQKLLEGEETNNFEHMNESLKNMVQCYNELEELFPEEFDEKTFLYFSHWLIQKVYLIEIETESEEDAYTIFETMNDRGLPLSPVDMLKGYLLSNIKNEDDLKKAVEVWKSVSEDLRQISEDGISEGIKTLLRSQYANTIRERKKGATPQDFDKIGTEFHRWVRDNAENLGLKDSKDYFKFISEDLNFYLRIYEELRKASDFLNPDLKNVYYISKLKFTLQYPAELAPIKKTDNKEEIYKKLAAVSTYLDILLARRIWNFRSFSYSDMQFNMYSLVKEIRRKNLSDLTDALYKKLKEDPNKFSENPYFYLHQGNRFYIHYLLARITDFIEVSSGGSSKFQEYMATGINKYEVEHIWARHYERHLDEFASESDFERYRNYIGGLLLLPKKFNTSYGDLTYEEKVKHYDSQNLLARSLNSLCYEHNPGFIQFIKKYDLPFKSYEHFKKDDLEERQRLYLKLAELVWSPEQLKDYA